MAKKENETNPFVQFGTNFTINAVWKMEELVTSGTENMDIESTSRTSLQWRAYKFETDDKLYLYTDGILGLFANISSASKDMFMYIASRVAYNKDYIELEEDKYCATMCISHTTFFTAKRDLINRLLIPRPARKNTYWVNPGYLFRGNRMEKYPDNVVMRNEHPFEKFKKKEVKDTEL